MNEEEKKTSFLVLRQPWENFFRHIYYLCFRLREDLVGRGKAKNDVDGALDPTFCCSAHFKKEFRNLASEENRKNSYSLG